MRSHPFLLALRNRAASTYNVVSSWFDILQLTDEHLHTAPVRMTLRVTTVKDLKLKEYKPMHQRIAKV